MECHPKFHALSLCLVIVTVFVEFTTSSNDQFQEPYSSLALGKEYVLVQSDQNPTTVRAWNYSKCEINYFRYHLENEFQYPLVLNFSESKREFVLNAKVEWMTYRFLLGQEFICDRHNATCVATLNGTIFTVRTEKAELKTDLTSKEMQLNWFVNSTPYTTPDKSLLFKTKQRENNSFLLKTTESLSAEFEKEYILELSDSNKKIINEMGLTQCTVDVIIAKYPLVVKLNKKNDTFVLTVVWNVYDTTFQLGKQTKDSRGLLSTFTLNGTTLTRVSHGDDGSAARTSVWTFNPDEVLYQEVNEDSNATLTFKARS